MYDEMIHFCCDIATGEKDNYGDPVIKKTITGEAYAELRSIGQSEFYQAQTSGFKPEIKFVLADYLDYDDQPFVIYQDMCYKVLRTYRKNRDLEITCYGGVRYADAKVSD